MIELIRAQDSVVADGIEAALRDLVVAHRITMADQADTDLPVIVDGGRRYPADQIPSFLDQLRRDVADWNRFQSDACYIDDDGSVC
jgi:hypothetical protein